MVLDAYDGIQLYNYKSNSGALLGNSKGTYVESAGLVSTMRTWERIYNYNLGIDFRIPQQSPYGYVRGL